MKKICKILVILLLLTWFVVNTQRTLKAEKRQLQYAKDMGIIVVEKNNVQ